MSTWIDVSGVNLIAPMMSLTASVCITYNFLTVVSVAALSASQPYYREGYIHALHIPISVDLELPHFVPASLFKTLFFHTFVNCFLYTVSPFQSVQIHSYIFCNMCFYS